MTGANDLGDAAARQRDGVDALRDELQEILGELRAATDELRRQERLLDEAGSEVAAQMLRYRELFDFAPDGHLLTRTDGLIQEVNLAAGSMLGVDPVELIGTSLPQYFAAPDRRRILSLLRQATTQAGRHDAEVTMAPRRGTPFRVSVHVGVTSDAATPVRWLVHDISARRAAEQRHEEALHREQEVANRLRDMDAIKNAFLLAVSHDLRGPLTAVVALARMLAEDRPMSAERQRRITESVVANAARIERVQRNLVDLDRLARHAVALQPEPIDVDEVVAASVAAADVGDRPVRIQVTASQPVLDRAVVERVLDNLLSNAMLHTPHQTPVEVAVEPEGDGLVITVSDHGLGIPAALRHVIFEPFGAAMLGGRNGAEGTARGVGVGLHLVSRFAELHGGRAWVEPTPGGGASFRVLLREGG